MNNEREEIVLTEDTFIIENDDRLNDVLARLRETLGNTKKHQKLTSIFFQGKKEFQDLSIDELVEKDAVYLTPVLLHPTNVNMIGAFLSPISFKKEIFSLKQSDLNVIANGIDEVFEKAVITLEQQTEDAEGVKDEVENSSKE